MRAPIALLILSLVGKLAIDEEPAASLHGRVEGARARSFLELRVDAEHAPRLVALASDGTFACEALPAGREIEVDLRWEGFQVVEEELGLNRDQRRRSSLAPELLLVPGETRTVHWRVPPPTRVRGRALLLPERTQGGRPVVRGGVGATALRVLVPAGACELRVLEPDGSERRVVVEAKRGEVTRVELGRARALHDGHEAEASGARIR